MYLQQAVLFSILSSSLAANNPEQPSHSLYARKPIINNAGPPQESNLNHHIKRACAPPSSPVGRPKSPGETTEGATTGEGGETQQEEQAEEKPTTTITSSQVAGNTPTPGPDNTPTPGPDNTPTPGQNNTPTPGQPDVPTPPTPRTSSSTRPGQDAPPPGTPGSVGSTQSNSNGDAGDDINTSSAQGGGSSSSSSASTSMTNMPTSSASAATSSAAPVAANAAGVQGVNGVMGVIVGIGALAAVQRDLYSKAAHRPGNNVLQFTCDKELPKKHLHKLHQTSSSTAGAHVHCHPPKTCARPPHIKRAPTALKTNRVNGLQISAVYPGCVAYKRRRLLLARCYCMPIYVSRPLRPSNA